MSPRAQRRLAIGVLAALGIPLLVAAHTPSWRRGW